MQHWTKLLIAIYLTVDESRVDIVLLFVLTIPVYVFF